MSYQSDLVAGTKFPATIGLTDDQVQKGVPLADGNIIKGHPKSFATLSELQDCPKSWLSPGNTGYVHLDPIAENNGKYVLSSNLLTWTKDVAASVSGSSDANLSKGGLHQYETIASRNAIPLSLRRHGMSVDIWEDATATAANGKLLPRTFKLTGNLTGGGTSERVTKTVPDVNVLELTYSDQINAGYENYMVEEHFEMFLSPAYVFNIANAPQPKLPFAAGYVAGTYSGTTISYHDDLDGVYEFWDNQPYRDLYGRPPGGGAAVLIGRRTYSNMSLGNKTLKYSYDTEAAAEKLDLQGIGDQSDVWTEVLPGNSTQPSSHNHDDRYYTEAEVNALLADKARLVNGKIDMAQLPDSVLGQLEYKGSFDANANIPVLEDPTTALGHYYVVRVAGTQHGFELGVGDWLVSDGTIWDKVDNTSEVSSVFGRKGVVTPQTGDYNADQITETQTRKFITPEEKEKINNPSLPNHAHPIAEVDGLQAALNKLDTNESDAGDLSVNYPLQMDRKRVIAAKITAAMQFTLNNIGLKKGIVGRLDLTCNNGIVPTFSAEFKKTAGEFVTPGLNYVEYYAISANRIEYEIYQ